VGGGTRLERHKSKRNDEGVWRLLEGGSTRRRQIAGTVVGRDFLTRILIFWQVYKDRVKHLVCHVSVSLCDINLFSESRTALKQQSNALVDMVLRCG
jgi:hypothetical protein